MSSNSVPILSVIIPVYNVEKYLQQCLDSVFDQDLENFEVICVNDGSTDSSDEILKFYKKKFSELIIVERENGGLATARNSGYNVASGKYVYFLDSDDYLFTGVLKRMIEFSEYHNLDVAHFNVEISTGGKYFNISKKPDTVLKGTVFFDRISNDGHSLPAVPVWMYVYKKQFLDRYEIVFKEGIVLEDNHFTLRLLFLAQRVHLLDIPIQFHRIKRPGAETHSVTKEQIASLLFTCRDLYAFYSNNDCDVKSFYDRIFLIYLNIAQRVLILKNYKDVNFNRNDYVILRKCLISNYYTLHYYLLRNKLFRIYKWYIMDHKHPVFKKYLRRLARVF